VIRRGAALLAVFALGIGAAGCEHDDSCSDAEAQRAGDACGELHVMSTFKREDELAREALGRMRFGSEWAEGAFVRMAPSPDLVGSEDYRQAPAYPTTAVTDAAGFYRFTSAPFRYDLTVRAGRDVTLFRGLYARYVEPSLGDDAPTRAFHAHVDVTIDPPVPPGQALAFFATGPLAVRASGDPTRGVDVEIREIAADVGLQVLRYPEGNLAAATAYGATDVHVAAGMTVAAHVELEPTPAPATFEIDADAPRGTVLGSAEVLVDTGLRTNLRSVTRALVGDAVSVVPFPGARWWIRVRGEIGGAVTDSGYVAFDPNVKSVKPKLPEAPELLAPAPNGALDGALSTLSLSAKGVVEHTLVPSPADDGRPTVRIVTIDRATRLPDPLAFAPAARPTGPYVWTARAWPALKRVDELSGPDVRLFQPTATSAPRTISLP
jgi:hypothetical protein